MYAFFFIYLFLNKKIIIWKGKNRTSESLDFVLQSKKERKKKSFWQLPDGKGGFFAENLQFDLK